MFGFGKKPAEDSKGTAVWIDEAGTIKTRVFSMEGSLSNEYIVLDFGQGEKLKVRSRYIRRKRVMIFKLRSGKIQVLNPDKWQSIPFKELGIKELRFNLQNFGYQERKSALSRWTLPADTITKLAPIFKIIFTGITLVALAWITFKYGGAWFNQITSARLLPCGDVLPRAVASIVTNSTAPIG